MESTNDNPGVRPELADDAEGVRMLTLNGHGEYDEAPGLTDEDREDLRDARAAMEDIRLNGSIPWEQVKAELGI